MEATARRHSDRDIARLRNWSAVENSYTGEYVKKGFYFLCASDIIFIKRDWKQKVPDDIREKNNVFPDGRRRLLLGAGNMSL